MGLTLLPEDIILNVFKNLSNPQSFSQASRHLYGLSKEPRFKAHWLVHHFGPRYALYYAILRMPHLCNDALLSTLVNCGAIVPRYLVQMIVQSYNGPRRYSTDIDSTSTPLDDATSRLPFTGYAYIVSHAWRHYGDIWDARQANDFSLFIKYAGYRDPEYRNMDLLKELIHTYGFIPVPLPGAPVMRNIILLARDEPAIFAHFSVPFRCDRLVRKRTWESVLLFIATYTSEPREPDRRALLFSAINRCLGEGPLEFDDKAVFKTTFVDTFSKQREEHPIMAILKQVCEEVTLTFSIVEAAREILEARNLGWYINTQLAGFLGLERVERIGDGMELTAGNRGNNSARSNGMWAWS
ncbi:hypothetical protein BC937DRAFT_91266 [Endogone sp. FLAS-F59071]|nr:hypothetical protein BC937DRAFT_91266 [Endogone sp. FLAS-F59071]|eukprot:RUS16392.1 hypothetical protein BC937DRAFT_91266 [Endogone sp. FLAS-F59071]